MCYAGMIIRGRIRSHQQQEENKKSKGRRTGL